MTPPHWVGWSEAERKRLARLPVTAKRRRTLIRLNRRLRRWHHICLFAATTDDDMRTSARAEHDALTAAARWQAAVDVDRHEHPPTEGHSNQ